MGASKEPRGEGGEGGRGEGKRSKLKVTSLLLSGKFLTFARGDARNTRRKFGAESCEGESSPAKFFGREKIKGDINFRKKSYKMRPVQRNKFPRSGREFCAEAPHDPKGVKNSEPWKRDTHNNSSPCPRKGFA